jgi:diadenosine tetraphosphate (Ap4A) HIT family hydrolase
MKSPKTTSPTMYQQNQQQTCDFCNEFSGRVENSFAARYRPDLQTRVLHSSKNFRVIPSLGQIVEGYLLIVPVKHYTAMADMPPELHDDLLRLCLRVRSSLSQVYGPALFFEHGVRGTKAGGCGVEHAHLHAVPFDAVREPIHELKNNHSFRVIQSISEISQRVSPNSPYLYYEETNGQAWVCETERIPSQYIRKLLAESIGIESWDWRISTREHALLSSISRLSGYFVGDSPHEVTHDGIASQAELAAAAGVL